MKKYAIMATLVILGLGLSGSGQAYAQSTYTLYLPHICKNDRCYGSAVWGVNTNYTACSDTTRGSIYRNLVLGMVSALSPVSEWSMSVCCPSATAQAQGHFIGDVLQQIPAIIAMIFQILWQMVSQAGTTFLEMIGAASAEATYDYDIACAGDVQYFCFGLAAIMAIDQVSSGWATVVVTLLVAILSFYLANFAIGQIRAMMQPGDTPDVE